VTIVISIGAFLLVTIATLIVSKVLDDPITWALASLLGSVGPHRRPTIAGVWKSQYDYRNPAGRQHVVQVIQLRQIGSYVKGRAISSSSSEHKHRVRGRLDEQVFTGTWENTIDGARHHGSMQLVLRTDGRAMTGQWIGFDRRNNVQHGEWNWQFIGKTEKKNCADAC